MCMMLLLFLFTRKVTKNKLIDIFFCVMGIKLVICHELWSIPPYYTPDREGEKENEGVVFVYTENVHC